MMDLKMRRVPAIAAEVIWNPMLDGKELEQRCRMIWQKQVGAWHDPINPYWKTPQEGSSEGGAQKLDDLGDMYRKMGPEDKKN